MNTISQFISYDSTGFFSKISTDYISGNILLKPFYAHPVSFGGIKAAIEARKKFPTNRELLADQLQQQYKGISLTEKQQGNLLRLNNANCFTITTAHQPNLFTGHLYFIYKILQVIKLAEQLENEMPDNNYVPVFYMGTEDADLEELGHIYLFGEKYEWVTMQTGAVGRMKVDKALLKIIDTIRGRLLVYPFGEEIIGILYSCYKEGTTIEQATFQFVNHLFASYGLVILLPDNKALKNAFIPFAEKEIKEGFSHAAVAETEKVFPKEYKVQAGGRPINLFYLKDDKRERIENVDGQWVVMNTNLKFSLDEILTELENYPERFSPNVILRPVFQEMILPDIVFIGGGGEIAYWLELKKVFEQAGVPIPVMVLRNSFLIVEERLALLSKRLGIDLPDLFKPEAVLLEAIVKKETTLQLSLENEKNSLIQFYKTLKKISEKVDVSLGKHTENLKEKAMHKLEALEKKMMKAEKKKFEAQQRQLNKLRSGLFPNNSLQERVENFLPYYAIWGKEFIYEIYRNSLLLEQQFCILKIEEK
jgi:bacillithiol biosynthesis cysteine-adding enzyme BshC